MHGTRKMYLTCFDPPKLNSSSISYFVKSVFLKINNSTAPRNYVSTVDEAEC